MPISRPAKRVYVISDAQLRENGGQFILERGPAIPVIAVTGDEEDGAVQPVYVLDANDLKENGGTWPLESRETLPVSSILASALDGRGIISGPAKAVYEIGSSVLGATYQSKVLNTESANLLAYWPLSEAAGAVANDVSGNARHGAYTGVTLGQPGIGDGNTSPLFDGVNDFVNVYTVSLRDAFNGAEGTAMIWARVFNVGVWTDGTIRRSMYLFVNGANRVGTFTRVAANNTLTSVYVAGGVLETQSSAGHAEITWLHIAITWSASAGVNGEVLYYIDGSQDGLTDTALGVWAGNLAVTGTCIGATSTAPANPWSGWLAHAAVWNTPLTPAQIASLAVV